MILDTNILIAYLANDPAVCEAIQTWKQTGQTLFVSSLSRVEVLAFPSLTDADMAIIQEFLGNFISLPFNDALVESAASLRRRYRLSLPDAAIAATALTYQMSLVTRDRKLRKVKELIIVEV